MATKNYEINMDLGYIPLTINFTGGQEPTEILINPADVDIVKRLFEAQKRINEKSGIMKELELDENGVPNPDEYIEKATILNDTICEALDYAFASKISDKIFKYVSPVAMVDGKPFVMQFLEKITPFIEEIMKSEQKKSKAYTDKYLKKYIK